MKSRLIPILALFLLVIPVAYAPTVSHKAEQSRFMKERLLKSKKSA